MNANHQRHLIATFRYIDRLLEEAEQLLENAGSGSPFAEHAQDASPVQRKVTEDYIRGVRVLLDRLMLEFGLPRPAPTRSALWAAATRVRFAEIALHDLRPEEMRGSGLLTEDDVAHLGAAGAELKAALDRLARYLRQGSDADLAARLERLERTRDEVPLLRELERIITAHGLVDLRATLSMLLDAIEHRRFEIGLFGRTSSGKSSLLNHLLGTAVLPVGVTPVTAVPTRVEFGPRPRVLVDFADSPGEIVEPARLAEYSAEQKNPANRRHVTRIVVELPAARLREGVTFVDTPGLGSLATAGAAETQAYLPRCDVGIVLLDAGAAPAIEDLVLIRTLLHAGSRVMVLVSKADLLDAAEREQFVAYLREQLTTQIGATPPTSLVSTAAGDAALADEWYEQALRPLLARHAEEAAASLKRKVGLLRETVVSALEERSSAAEDAGARSPDDGATREGVQAALTALREAEGRFASVGGEIDELVDKAARINGAIIEACAAEIASAWRGGQTAASDAAGLVVVRIVSAFAPAIVERLEALRADLEIRLARSLDVRSVADRSISDRSVADPAEAAALPHAQGAPLFDAARLAQAIALAPPPLSSVLPAAWLRRYAEARLRADWRDSLQAFLDEHRRRLRRWSSRSLAELHERFHAQAAPLLAQLEAPPAPAAVDACAIAADLQRLRDLDAVAAGGEGSPPMGFGSSRAVSD